MVEGPGLIELGDVEEVMFVAEEGYGGRADQWRGRRRGEPS